MAPWALLAVQFHNTQLEGNIFETDFFIAFSRSDLTINLFLAML